jgi:hypothetical protein
MFNTIKINIYPNVYMFTWFTWWSINIMFIFNLMAVEVCNLEIYAYFIDIILYFMIAFISVDM